MKKLMSESSDPLYAQLMDQIKTDINRGLYPVGSRIPPEHALVDNYNVSRVTVRRALSELTSEGLLERKQGKGTFVSAPKIMQDIKNIHSFHESCKKNGCIPGTKVLLVHEIKADALDIHELNLNKDASVIETIRVMYADHDAVVLETNHFSMAYAYLEDSDLTGSLYGTLHEFGIVPARATHEISICKANDYQADLLNIEQGTALLRLREVVYDQKGRPLHNSLQLIRGDRFIFRI